MLADLPTGLLEHVGELAEGQAPLPTEVAVPVLEELLAVLADAEVRSEWPKCSL